MPFLCPLLFATAYQHGVQQGGLRPQVVLMMMPRTTPVYKRLKKMMATQETSVPVQFANETTFTPRGGRVDKSKMVNLMMQVVNKMGISTRRIAGMRALMGADKRMLVVGIDKRQDSVALVYTVDSECDRPYAFLTSTHGPSRAIIDEHAMQQAMVAVLQVFRQENGGALPTGVILYRTGTSSGQLDRVQDSECKGVRNAFAELGFEPECYSYIVVTQRDGLQMVQEQGSSRPPPGVVVDDSGIVPKGSFYLLSHSGAIESPLYNQVDRWAPEREHATWDENLKQFSFALAHMYTNWAGTVPLPHVLKNAQKVVQYLSDQGISSSEVPDFNRRLMESGGFRKQFWL